MNRKLYRNMRDKMVAGVCSGLADYLQTDVSVVRLVFLLAFLGIGAGPIAYLILWVVLPVQYGAATSNFSSTGTSETSFQENTANGDFSNTSSKSFRTNLIMGIVLITMGTLFLIDNLVSYEFFSTYWPVLLIIAGLAILFAKSKKNEQG